MTTARKPTFAQTAAPFIERAKLPTADLLPLIPPGATLADGTSVKPFQIGKIPGRYSRGEWWGLRGEWPTMGFTERDQIKAANWPTQNIGLRAADFPGVDSDVATDEAAALVEELVAKHLGWAPKRTRTNSPAPSTSSSVPVRTP